MISEGKNILLWNVSKWNIDTMKRFFHKPSEAVITRIFITNNVKAESRINYIALINFNLN